MRPPWIFTLCKFFSHWPQKYSKIPGVNQWLRIRCQKRSRVLPRMCERARSSNLPLTNFVNFHLIQIIGRFFDIKVPRGFESGIRNDRMAFFRVVFAHINIMSKQSSAWAKLGLHTALILCLASTENANAGRGIHGGMSSAHLPSTAKRLEIRIKVTIPNW